MNYKFRVEVHKGTSKILESYIFNYEQLMDFGEKYIGSDLSEYGTVFKSQEDLKSGIDYIIQNGEEDWYLGDGEDVYIWLEGVKN